MKFFVFSLLCVLSVSLVHGEKAPTAIDIVARHSLVLTAPVGGPTKLMARGPLLGNGDVGVMQSGPADGLVYYIGKNDFWSIKHQSPIAVGQVRILTPALKGASFKTVSDMAQAEIRGDYAKDGAALASRAWVDANRNLLCIELANQGSVALPVTVQTVKGAGSPMGPASVPESPQTVKIGCEQHGGGRWFFNGEMADVTIEDRALPLEAVAQAARAERKEVQAFDGKTSKAITAPPISKALTVSAWIKPTTRSHEADYMVSKGTWDQGFSLGLSTGRPRFSIGGFMLQADEMVPLNQWTHVAGVFDGGRMELVIDGQVKKSAGSGMEEGGSFLYDPDAPTAGGRKVGVAMRVIGAADDREFKLEPGKSVTVVVAVQSDLDAKGQDAMASAKAMVGSLTPNQIATNLAAHRKWWAAFWNRSFIEIPDKTIEQCWYASWYVMGSCSRAGKVAPGLWGNWITVNNPAWHGDYHLNYNFQAPFYGLYSANHADTSLPFYDAMNQFIPRGKSIAEKRGWKGIHLPVSIGPWGMCPEGDNSDWGQHSNAAYAALPYIWYWQHTRDKAWLKSTGYNYLRETAAFWEDYLKLENGPDGNPRYVIHHDAIHEGSGGAGRSGVSADGNPLLSLGLVRALFQNLVPMSEALGVDADKRAKWSDIRARLSDYPTQQRNGKTVFRYCETGTGWWNDNTLGIQHIFPAGGIGLGSDPQLIEISRNMIDVMGRWRDYNGSSSWYTACARVGCNPDKILSELRNMYDKHTLPNKLLNFGGGGIENVSPALAVSEMLMQSHEGVIRLFPCWPKNQDARFGTLRAAGAFLVSAELKGGEISGVYITSENGSDLTVQNPWPGHSVVIVRGGKTSAAVSGERFTVKTAANETLELRIQRNSR